jgi:phospholipid/cholesterol/gamma-HCH transport system permease protein
MKSSLIERVLRALGRPVISMVRDTLVLLVLLLRTIREIVSLNFNRREVVHQAFECGNRSLLFLLATMGFIGMIMVLQACYQAQRLVGDYSLVGPGYLQLLVREFAPTIGAMMIATRVGAGIAAEIGSMAVTEQLDALRMNGADPIVELVVPRALACAFMVPALLIIAGGAAEISALLTAKVAFAIAYEDFFSTRMITLGDVFVGLIKAQTFGFVIPIVSARAGLIARGGSAGVGSATTRAVIDTSLSIIFLDFVLNVVLYPLYARI